MNEDQQLKLQAFFDGELPEAEAREVAAWIARDSDATMLMTELRNTRKALAGFEPDLKLPESREFYWSKIERQIQSQSPAPKTEESVSLFTLLRRFLMPASAIAVLVIAGFLATHQLGTGAPVGDVDVSMTDADAGAFTYRDQSEGTTLVWLSYPSEKKFTDAGARDTLQP
jgi:anti-sigma factor RsiW